MLLNDINSRLRATIIKLINSGWSKTPIGKVLLGSNGQSYLNHWLKGENKNGHNFGIKPLNRISKLIDYETHVVFIKKPSEESHNNYSDNVKYLEQQNEFFINELEDVLIEYLTNNVDMPRSSKTGKGQIDHLLDDLIG